MTKVPKTKIITKKKLKVTGGKICVILPLCTMPYT